MKTNTALKLENLKFKKKFYLKYLLIVKNELKIKDFKKKKKKKNDHDCIFLITYLISVNI